MRWTEAASDQLLCWLGSSVVLKPCSLPAGHNTGLLNKPYSSVEGYGLVLGYGKIPGQKYQLKQELWLTLDFAKLGSMLEHSVTMQNEQHYIPVASQTWYMD